MKKAIKIILLVLLFLGVAAGSVLGYRWYSERQTAAAPISTEGLTYLTTVPEEQKGTVDATTEPDDMFSDSSIADPSEVAWPFADSKLSSDFKAKTTVAEKTGKSTRKDSTKTTAKASSDKETTKKDSKETTKKDSKETTKKASGSVGSQKEFLEKVISSANKTQNGHPVKVDSNGINIEYKKFAVADLNGDGKNELFLYAESTKGKDFYGNSYIVYDNALKNARTTMVVDAFDAPVFYASGAYEINTNKFGFVSDSVAQSFGVKNENSILGYDTNSTPYLKYMTNGPYIDSPSEISAADYKAAVSKLKAGGKVKVKVYDFTKANVESLS